MTEPGPRPAGQTQRSRWIPIAGTPPVQGKTFMANDIPRLMSVIDAANRLGVSTSFLNKLRVSGDGPPFVKIGTRVVYDPADLAVWLGGQKRASTGGAA